MYTSEDLFLSDTFFVKIILNKMTKNPKKMPEFGPLHAAAITGDKESLKTIFRNNLCDINYKDKVG